MKISVGKNTLTIRKWKGKDKKAFLNILKNEEPSELDFVDTILYPCIEENVILGKEEIKYVLSRIRAYSIGEEFNVHLTCDHCKTGTKHTFKLCDTIRLSYKDVNEINSNGVKIKLGKIRNKSIYLKMIQEDDLFDLLLRIESFNGDDSFTFEEIVNKFDDLDVDILEDILSQWENIRFKIDDVNDVTCPSCNTVEKYSFNEIPNFFPESWNL